MEPCVEANLLNQVKDRSWRILPVNFIVKYCMSESANLVSKMLAILHFN